MDRRTDGWTDRQTDSQADNLDSDIPKHRLGTHSLMTTWTEILKPPSKTLFSLLRVMSLKACHWPKSTLFGDEPQSTVSNQISWVLFDPDLGFAVDRNDSVTYLDMLISIVQMQYVHTLTSVWCQCS